MILIFALFAVATRSAIAAALPVDLVENAWTTPNSYGGAGGEMLKSLYTRDDTSDSDNLRTISSIIWSCLATVFACSWVSVHPNIPSPQDSDFSVLRRRVGLMFWGIIAPELLIIWAMRQWIEARKIAKKYRSRGWTNAHGHFLVMGGFMLYDQEGKPVQTLSIEKFTELLKDQSIDFPLITKKEILDRSKGDLLSKSIIIIQVAWFAVQCMARSSQGLAITELELVTLAFTTLNGAMYFFWWDKPLDVQSTVRVPLKKPVDLRPPPKKKAKTIADFQVKRKSEEIDIAETMEMEVVSGPSEDATSGVVDHKYEPVKAEAAPSAEDDNDDDDERPFTTRVRDVIIETMQSLRHAIAQPFKEIARYVAKRGLVGSIWRIFVYLPIKNILYGFGNIVESDTSQKVAPGALRVPMFYAPQIGFEASDITRIVASALGIIFGGIHLAAWSGDFPTHQAQIAWRVTSLIVTLLPAVIFIAKVLGRSFEELGDFWDDCFSAPLFVIEFLTGSGGILIYVPSRIALFVIAFYCLKSIPPSGYQKTQILRLVEPLPMERWKGMIVVLPAPERQ